MTTTDTTTVPDELPRHHRLPERSPEYKALATRIAKRQAIGDPQAANDSTPWPLAVQLRREGNDALLHVAERYRASMTRLNINRSSSAVPSMPPMSTPSTSESTSRLMAASSTRAFAGRAPLRTTTTPAKTRSRSLSSRSTPRRSSGPGAAMLA